MISQFELDRIARTVSEWDRSGAFAQIDSLSRAAESIDRDAISRLSGVIDSDSVSQAASVIDHAAISAAAGAINHDALSRVTGVIDTDTLCTRAAVVFDQTVLSKVTESIDHDVLSRLTGVSDKEAFFRATGVVDQAAISGIMDAIDIGALSRFADLAPSIDQPSVSREVVESTHSLRTLIKDLPSFSASTNLFSSPSEFATVIEDGIENELIENDDEVLEHVIQKLKRAHDLEWLEFWDNLSGSDKYAFVSILLPILYIVATIALGSLNVNADKGENLISLSISKKAKGGKQVRLNDKFSTLHVRSGPGEQYNINHKLDHGSHVTASTTIQGWTYIEMPTESESIVGWVATEFLVIP